MKCNVYDFDNTIYDGDSTADFYKYCIKKYPKALYALPRASIYFAKYKLKRCSKTIFKENFYGFLKLIPNIDEDVKEFWRTHDYKIKQWYLKRRHENDIIISASPEFLLHPICEKLQINRLIASQVDKRTGKTHGENCYGKEKVLRLNREIPQCEIVEFFSDSKSDQPLADLAEKSYIVNGDKIITW